MCPYSRPEEVGLHKDAAITITELEEGEEKSAFWHALEDRDRTIYHSLLKGLLGFIDHKFWRTFYLGHCKYTQHK